MMLLFWHYQKLSQLDPGVKISYDILTPPLPSRYFYPPEIIDDKVLFAVHIYLTRSIIKIVSMTSWIVKMLLFWHYQNLSELDPGVKISYDPLKNRWQSFVCILYLVDKIYHYVKIIVMISWTVIMILFWNYQKLA